MATQKVQKERVPYQMEYSGRYYPNPSDNIDPKIKQQRGVKETEEYYVRKARFIYSSYLRDDTVIPFSTVDDICINRLYAQGKQPISKYRDHITLFDPNTGERKGWMNISDDICPVLPKFRNRVCGEFDGLDFGTNVYAIDEYSMAKRENRKRDLLVKTKYKEELNPIKEAIGIREDPSNIPFEPNNMEEVNMWFGMGFEKLDEEIQMDTSCIATEQRCGWSETKKRMIEDLVDCGIAGCKDYNDPVTNLPMVRYCDPENLIVRQTRMNDFSNVTEGAEIVWFSLSDLRMNGLTEDQIIAARNSYMGKWGNPYYNRNDQYNYSYSNYDEIRVAVLDAEFASFDTYTYEERRDGKIGSLSYGEPASNKKNKRWEKKYQKLYRCKWIIGTDIVFDYGLQYDVTYTQDGYPKSSYSLYRVAERSMISQCISIADDLQLAILRFRNALAQAKPAGIQVEWSSLVEIATALKMEPLNVLTIYNHTGNLLFKYKSIDNGMPIQGLSDPVKELVGGAGPYLQECLQTIEFNINMLREITGINASVDASTPANDALVGTSQMAYQSTMKVLKPVLSAYKNIKQRAFSNIVTRWQLARKFYGISSTTYHDPVSGTTQKVSISAGVYDLQFNNYCEELINDQEKAELQQACLASMQAAKTGSVGITMADYFMIKQLIARNNVRAAWLYLAYREAQLQQQQAQVAMQNQQANTEGAMAAEQMKGQNEIMKIREKGNEDRKTKQLEYMYDLQLKKMELAAKPVQVAPSVKAEEKEEAK